LFISTWSERLFQRSIRQWLGCANKRPGSVDNQLDIVEPLRSCAGSSERENTKRHVVFFCDLLQPAAMASRQDHSKSTDRLLLPTFPAP